MEVHDCQQFVFALELMRGRFSILEAIFLSSLQPCQPSTTFNNHPIDASFCISMTLSSHKPQQLSDALQQHRRETCRCEVVLNIGCI